MTKQHSVLKECYDRVVPFSIWTAQKLGRGHKQRRGIKRGGGLCLNFSYPKCGNTYYVPLTMFQNRAFCQKYLKDNKRSSLHLARKYARIFVEKRTVFRERSSKKLRVRGTDNVQGQISERSFAPNGGYCVFIPCSTNIW